ncbi:DUF2752 domain-containing protein [Vallitaleaceae bacterium 9-2]
MNYKFRKNFLQRIKNLFIPIVLVGGVLLIFSAWTKYQGYPTICPIKLTTGLPCPGCGMTRAHIALLNLDLSQALYYHPLFFVPAGVFAIFLFQDIRWVYRLHHSKWFYPLLVMVVIGVYIYRMLLRFPFEEPLEYSEKNFLKQIWDNIPR